MQVNTMTRLEVIFYRTESGSEPVREWIKKLAKEDKKIIGEEMKAWVINFGK
jgi:hypothetical protein